MPTQTSKAALYTRYPISSLVIYNGITVLQHGLGGAVLVAGSQRVGSAGLASRELLHLELAELQESLFHLLDVGIGFPIDTLGTRLLREGSRCLQSVVAGGHRSLKGF